MLSFIVPMFPFILSVILIGGLWLHDVSYRHHELAAGKVRQRLP